MELEHCRILAACSLTKATYKGSVPPIYAEMLAEGCSKVAVDAILNLRLKPYAHSDNPVLIYVSPELVRDIKELKFGLGLDITYQTCHRVLSPFVVPHTS